MQVFGHRGAAGEAPENTIAGVRHAIATGISRIEIDLRLTSDLQLVVLHDRNLKRTTGIDKNIDRLSAAELQAIAGNNVPTLATLLAAAPELECVQLEIKSDQSTNARALAQALAQFFPDAQSAQRFVATSFDSDIIDALARHAPQLRRGLVAKREAAHALATAKELHCDYLC
ncbi:MAG: hypothetical protein HKO71_04925, partial [Pseudomonadales bacterium]|nr:hypothetical protein [Pseudomonadales bacterium]